CDIERKDVKCTQRNHDRDIALFSRIKSITGHARLGSFCRTRSLKLHDAIAERMAVVIDAARESCSHLWAALKTARTSPSWAQEVVQRIVRLQACRCRCRPQLKTDAPNWPQA